MRLKTENFDLDAGTKPKESTTLEQQKDNLSEYFSEQVKANFFKAIQNSNLEMIKNFGMRFQIDLEMRDEMGNTPLNMAAQAEDLSMYKLLIAMGANEETRNKIGKQPRDYIRHLL